jgi:hypothetical protein
MILRACNGVDRTAHRDRLASASVGRPSGASRFEGSPPEPARRAGDQYSVVAERLRRECARTRAYQSGHIAGRGLMAGSLRQRWPRDLGRTSSGCRCSDLPNELPQRVSR